LARRRLLFLAFITAALESMPALAQEPPQNFVLDDAPQPLADVRFQDSAGKSLGLSSFRGKVVLLNIWASWCVPCRKEMPTLDRLQAKLGGADFAVLPLSIDRAMSAVDGFYGGVGIAHLGKYLDASGEAAGQLNTLGVPTTLLIDRQGRELGRLVGPAEWDGPDMIAFLQGIIARNPAP
jgi:thiol-disulfide isomerase/thioredoxin